MRHTAKLGIVLLCAATAAFAQSAPSERVCTDISGKIRLACPNEKAANAPVTQREPVSPDSAQTPSTLEPVNSGHTPQPTAASPDPGSPVPTPATRAAANPAPYHSLEYSFARNLVFDQKDFWTSPLKLRVQDSRWLLPLAAGTAVVVLSDGDIERKLPTSTNLINQSKTFSDYGAAGYAGLVAAGYLWSRATNNEHLRETAVLSGEAAINSLLVTEGVKYIAGRARPFENRAGDFQQGGSSFPSLHAAGAWSIASVIAREYPGPLTQLLAYGGAAAISAARVTGRQHFASDALVGSAIGWYAGRQIYNAHHDRENPDSIYGTFQRTSGDRGSTDPDTMGSAYVPLDSWIYTAIERLAAFGYVRTAILGMRPWTRMECARLVDEASDNASTDDDAQVDGLIRDLRTELEWEGRRRQGAVNLGAQVESAYVRFTAISGEPLTDDYHFGKTITDDFGRPFGSGVNAVAGLSTRAEAGPLVFYVRGEYQRAGSTPELSADAISQIAAADNIAQYYPPRTRPLQRGRLLDAYVALNIGSYQFSAGQQSLWWGPGSSSAFMLSDNADPIPMLRVSRVKPFELPGPFRWMGQVRSEAFFGTLGGVNYINLLNVPLNQYVHYVSPTPPRYIHGQKLSFKPTENLEFGFSVTTVFGGVGMPLSWGTFRHSFSLANANPGDPRDPGDRRSGFDFTYRLPKLRKWLVLYNDSFTEDEFSPVAYPRRSAMNPGVYVPQLPHLKRLDFRFEGGYTALPGLRDIGFYYHNNHYASGYTNDGNIIGSWLGREGRSLQGSSTYWFSAQNKIRFGYRQMNVDPQFLEGGALHDGFVQATWSVMKDVVADGTLQVERWRFPLLSPEPQTNVLLSIRFTFVPRAAK